MTILTARDGCLIAVPHGCIRALIWIGAAGAVVFAVLRSIS